MCTSKHQAAKITSSHLIRHIYAIILLFSLLPSHPLLMENTPERKPKETPVKLSGFILDETDRVCDEFFSPFTETDRKSLSLLKDRITGIYGEYRRSYKPGHFHAGLDLKGDFNERVYAIGFGWIVQIFRQFPHRSVVVEHHLPDGSILYSMYVHIEDIQVQVGDWVDENIPLARLFNAEELESADFGTPNHLHLEIRKTLADRGRASYASMSMAKLNMACIDPLKFFKGHLK
ncbi:MAG: peptidoglycan DD-metalloendopeptidase family protein [Candidatus Aminicenantes bacterium]|jgi:murein DD-endopeptidase MepM/ murein hydrolase activator NlpD|nr:peptidoglycan DD-metalloendopeptidase family protein [Candidatus Aminicenantes bacterium]